MKLYLQTLIGSVILSFIALNQATAQCTDFDVVHYDSFEHTNVVPEIVPGTVVHNTPQTFSARTGTYAMYLNMINCNGGTGTCAGDSIYHRVVTCCPTQPIRFRWFMETVFSGALSNIRVVISNGNDSILAEVASTTAPYNAWTEFITPAVIPGTFNVKLTIYTNIDGQNGNDLGIDDMYVEKCANGTTTSYPICQGAGATDLFAQLPNNPVTTGTWTGPSALGNGYLGTYVPGTNATGNYVYTSTPYGSTGTCAVVNDTIVVSNNPGTSPQPNLGLDRTACVNTPTVLVAGLPGGGTQYLWSTMATTSNITAFSGIATTVTYSVTVTAANGCIGRDTVVITFEVCSGLNEFDRSEEVNVFPNPATEFVTVKMPADMNDNSTFTLMSVDGREVLRSNVQDGMNLSIPAINSGIYIYTIRNTEGSVAYGRLTIRK